MRMRSESINGELQWQRPLGTLAIAVVAAAVARSAVRRLLAHSFRGSVVVITGGSRGLGLELARAWGEEGALVAICARTRSDLDRAQADLSRRGIDTLAIQCDIRDEQQVQRFIDRILDRWGRIDVLVNNAGVIQVGPLDCMEVKDFHNAMACHFWGPLHAILAVLEPMRQRGEGRIVNISSIGGKIAVPHLLPYCASKFALAGLSEGLHAELARDGISVTSVFPGLMRTGSPRNAEFRGKHQQEYAWFSISDAQPGITIGSRRAARQILEACRCRQPELILSLPAAVGVKLRALLPRLSAALLRVADRVLPDANGSGSRGKMGSQSFSKWSPSLLTALNERAAAANNELRPGQ